MHRLGTPKALVVSSIIVFLELHTKNITCVVSVIPTETPFFKPFYL